MSGSWKVRTKSRHAGESWITRGSYGDERSALRAAQRLAGQYLMVQVLDPNGMVIWSH